MAARTVQDRIICIPRQEAPAAEAAAVADQGGILQSRVGLDLVRLCGTRLNKCSRSRPFVNMLRT
ncbi:hypothetical protein [Brucella sp.]|uniref:hypothetical protein n=1 Tax=Brucella sp. TaxID=52132 RepID=UPI0028A6EE9D|nr:hypothetical protein [Brucella sp.]